MNDDQRLALLDRRAAAATTALDKAVQQVPVPEPDLGAPRRSVRRFLPLAVAAGLAIIALVGAALMFDDDEQSTIADQHGAITRLALPDPEALGYRIVGAFDGSQEDAATGLNITMTIHSPVDGPRWEMPVVSYSLDADQTTLSGESVDIGGPDAVFMPSAGTQMIAWSEGDRVRFIGGPGYSAEKLTALVTRTIAEKVPDGAPLPGHEIIHVAPYTDLYPALVMSSSVMTSDVAGIGYEPSGDADMDMFAVATSRGSEDRWRASFALAVDTERLTVRGREAVRADFGDGLTQISWLENESTLVRVDAFGGEIPVEVLEQLEPISSADFADLVDEHGTGDGVEVHDIDAIGEEIEAPEPILPGDESSSAATVNDRQPMAQVDTEYGSVRIRATLLRAADRSGGRAPFDFEINAEGTDGGTGLGQSVPDLATNVLLRDQFSPDEWSGVMIGGVIGPDVETVDVVDAGTGTAVGIVKTSPIQHSDHVVFLATLGPEYQDRDLVVVGTTAAGEEIRLRAPARP